MILPSATDDRLFWRGSGSRSGAFQRHQRRAWRKHGLSGLWSRRHGLVSDRGFGRAFYLGDCHAVQGDGEIVGTGIETTFEVEFRLSVAKGWKLSWPRGETKTYIFSVGNARPLDQALQHATTDMLNWLTTDYGLSINAASHLLGQVVRYDVGNVFDPAYTMVCSVSKEWLPAIGAGVVPPVV